MSYAPTPGERREAELRGQVAAHLALMESMARDIEELAREWRLEIEKRSGK